MITAENITDEQIRELARSLDLRMPEHQRRIEEHAADPLHDGFAVCSCEMSKSLLEFERDFDAVMIALGYYLPSQRDKARARCADLLNARKAAR